MALNFAGKSGFHADVGSGAHGVDSLSHSAEIVTIPDAHLLFSGDYQRSGNDLIVSDQLHRVVVPDYFHGDKRPTLVSPEGAPLDPKVIEALTGHVQYAQAGPTAAAAKVVGHVVKMTGSASIVRNGVTIDLNNGDVVYQNDVVQTGSGSTLGLVMIDGTTFNLTANARLMMNDLTYDANSTSNTALFTLVQGAANFVAGQVAKTGDMKVGTPVATMGIRGTAVILDISAVDGKVSISVIDQRDGQIHAVQVFNTRGDLIGTVTSNGSTLTLTPTATFEVIAQESNKTVAQVAAEFNAFQQVLTTYDIGKQMVPSTPAPTDGRRGDATPQTTTKFAGTTIIPSDSSATKFNTEIASTKEVKGDAGTTDAATSKPTGDVAAATVKVAVVVGDAPVQVLDVPVTAIPFVLTPAAVSRISAGSGDHFGPVMSADGQFVTYDPDGAIFLFDRQAGTTTTIASPGGGFTYGSPTISADGHFIVYQGSDGAGSFIFIYNNNASDQAHYGQTTRLMSGGQPAISGDGSRIVVERGGSIGLYDQQGHELASITGSAVGTAGTLWKPAISADGHVVAFWSSDQSTPGGAGQLFTYDLSSATFRSIASTATNAGNSAASFSADGHFVVYQSDAPGGHSEIYLNDLRNGEVVFHTANADASYNPVISPDGHFIIFASDARLTTDDKNNLTDIYVVDVTDLSRPVYKLVSVLDDGTQGNAASNLGATISAGGQFVAFGSSASNFASGDTPGTGDIFVVDPNSGHSAIILEGRSSPAVLTVSGVIKLTGDHTGVSLGVSDTRITASFDSRGDIQWRFSEQRSDFASLQPGDISVQNFFITLSTARSTTNIPLRISIYDVDQAPAPATDAAPVASPVTLAAGTEDTSYTITSAALLAGVVDIDGPSLSITALGITSGGGIIVDNHDGTFRYTPAPNYNGPVIFNYTVSDGTLSASSTASLNVGAINDAPAIISAAFAVSEGGATVLANSNFVVADPDSTSFTFTVSNVSHGRFQITADGSVWVDAATFTTAELTAGHVRFVHDGGEIAPTFSIQADDGAASSNLSNLLAGAVNFTNVNDAPTLTSATLGVLEGGTTVLTAVNFAIADPDSTSFTFTVSNVSHGRFQTTADGSVWVDAATFTTAALTAGHVRFVHDGGEIAPTFSIQADDGAASSSNLLAGAVNFTNVNDAPTFTSATLAVSEGGTTVLTAADFAIADPDSTSFTFTVSNVSHGRLQTTADGSVWVDATTFTTAELTAGHVRFVHDGGEEAPTFSIQADDGEASNHLSATIAGAVQFTNLNDAPTVSSAVTGGGAEGTGPATVHLLDFASDADPGAVLHVANLVWTDTGSGFPAGVTQSVDGNSLVVDTNNPAYRNLAQGDTFTAHFGYDVTDEHGASVHQTATVTIAGTNDAPTMTSAGFSVSEGGTVVLGAPNITVIDPDSTSLAFTVTNVTHGKFQTSVNGSDWVDATTFTTADLNAGHVRFVHDGGELAPTFSVQANDGAASNGLSTVRAGNVSFSNVNDAPVITTAALIIAEGGTVVLGPSNVAVTDPDNNNFVFTVSNVSHGSFQITTDGVSWVPVTTFNSTSLGAGHVRFVHDGGEDAPTFSVQADDGEASNHLSATIDGAVQFTNVNDAPTVSSAVTGGGAEGTGPATVHLLDFASDADPGAVLHVANLVWTDTGSGFPAGITPSADGNSLVVDTNNPAYRNLAEGDTFTAHFGYDVTDEHGASVHQTATVTIAGSNNAPTVTSATLAVSEGGTTVLGVSNFAIADPDSASFTFTVSNVTHGKFQTTADGSNWVDATTFSTAGLTAGHVRFVHDGGEAAPTFSIQADDGAASNHLSATIAGAVQFTNVNDAPAITGVNSGVVHEDDPLAARTVTHQFTATDPDDTTAPVWTVEGGTTPQAAQYSFRIGDFKVTRTDSGGAFTFDDSFSDGIAAPNAPNFVGGGAASYSTTGSFTESTAGGGFETLDAAHAVITNSVGTGATFEGNFATLRTSTSAGASDGLRQGSDFTVEGSFDLINPTELRQGYGIRLTDRVGSALGDDTLDLMVRKAGNGVVAVQLRHLDQAGDNVTTVESLALTPKSQEDHILLRLSHIANSTAVSASFDFYAGNAYSRTITFTATDDIFHGETFTRASFFADSPSPSVSWLNGTYGALSIDSTGAWSYTLNNGSTAVQSLSEGETVHDVFTVDANDGHPGGTAQRTITIDVVGKNDAPSVAPLTAATTEDGPIQTFDLLSGAHDVESDPLTVANFAPAAHDQNNIPVDLSGAFGAGALVVGPNTVRIDPHYFNYLNAAQSVTLVGNYDVFDGKVYTHNTATLTINGVNDAPVAAAAGNTASGNEDSSISGTVPGGSDVDDASGLTYALESGPDAAKGALTFNSDGTFSFAPAANFNGTASFSYRVVDPHGAQSAPQSFVITVNPVNDAPVAATAGNAASGNEDSTISGSVPAGSDVDDASGLTYALESGPDAAKGALTFNSDGTFSFAPAANFNGTASFSYRVVDPHGAHSDPQNFVITVNPVNDAPVAATAGNAASGNEDSTISGSVPAGSDVDDASGLTYALESGPDTAKGALTFNSDGTFSFAPAANFNGTASFSYRVVDPHGAQSNPQSFVITVNPVNDAPTVEAILAKGDSAGTATPVPETDSALTVQGTLTITDPDQTDPVTVSVTGVTHSGPTGGLTDGDLIGFFSVPLSPVLSASQTSAHFTWSFNSGSEAFNFLAAGETLSLHYTIRPDDGHPQTGTGDGTVTIDIAGSNDAPVLTVTPSQPADVSEDGTLASSVTVSKSDPDASDVAHYDMTGWTPTALINDPAFAGHFYRYVPSAGISWTSARTQASAMGGHLANITSAAENNFIQDSVKPHVAAWIGASDAAQEGTWTWADGPEAGQTFWLGDGSGTAVTYANWWGVEPNGGTSENYAFIDHNGVWTDVPVTNSAPQGFIVEFDDFASFTSYSLANAYGNAVFNTTTGELTFNLDNASAAVQGLGASDHRHADVDIVVKDQSGAASTLTATFGINGANDAPTIDAATLAAVDEDTADPAGQSVATLFAGKFHDIDGSSFKGIAIVGNNATIAEGSWQYKTPQSGIWDDVGLVDAEHALIFSPATMLRFVPAPDFNGTPGGLDVLGVDDTYDDEFTVGAALRYTEDTTDRGGPTPFSAETRTVDTNITAVNDAPLLTVQGSDNHVLANSSPNDPTPWRPADEGVRLSDLGIAGDDAVTVEFWYDYSGATYAMPFGFGQYDFVFLDIYAAADDARGLGFNTGAGDLYGVSRADLVGGWHHYAVVFDGGDVYQSRLYIDGVEQTLTQLAGSSTNDFDRLSDDALIGGWTSDHQFGLDGAIDNVNIWHGSRSAADIAADMNGTPTGPQPDLVATYSFESVSDGPGGVTDKSGNGHDGTLSILTTANVIVDPTLSHPQLLNEDNVLLFSGLKHNGISVSDVDGDGLTVTLTVSHGVITLASTGGLEVSSENDTVTIFGSAADINAALEGLGYHPDADYNGGDTLVVTASDGALSDTKTIGLVINPVNDAPVATGETLSADANPVEDTVSIIPASLLLGNDTDIDDDPLTLASVTATANTHGTVQLVGGDVRYAPDANYNGPASFTYTVKDGSGAVSNVATVSFNVAAVNDAPVGVNDGYSTNEDTALTVAARGVLANDTDVDNDPATLTAVLVSGPGHGTLTLNSDGSFTYTPNANYNGPDSFSYRPRDGATTTTGNLIVNPGAELGSPIDDAGFGPVPQGWTNIIGNITEVNYTASGGFGLETVGPAINGGQAFFAGGPNNAFSQIKQTIDVSGYADDINAGFETANLSGYIGGLISQNDNISVTVHFIDGAAHELGSLTIDPTVNGVRPAGTSLIHVAGSAAVPVGTQSIDVVVTSLRAAGAYNDGYADNLSLTLTDSAPQGSPATVNITVNSVNDSPVIAGANPVTASVQEDVTTSVSGQLSSSDPDGGAPVWSVVGAGAVASHPADYAFKAFEFKLTGGGGTASFDDTFAVAPQNDTVNYFIPIGSFATTSGGLLLDDEHAGNFVGEVSGDNFVGQYATRTQNLNKADAFTLEGRFNLVIPADVRNGYGIVLTDAHGGGGNGNDALELMVQRGENGAVRVRLRDIDFSQNSDTTLATSGLTGSYLADDQIVLRAAHTAGSSALTFSYDLLHANGTQFGSGQLGSGTLFNGENTTRAELFGYALATAESYLTDPYGALAIDQAGAWTYSLRNGTSPVQALAGGQQVPESFTVQVSDGHGGIDTRTINVTIAGNNDAPVNTVPGSKTVNEDTTLAISGVSVSDIDTASLTTTLHVSNGVLNVAASGATVSGGNTATVTLSGSAAQINTALAGLTYKGASNYSGPDSLSVQTSDGSLSDIDNVAITVTAVNDAPAGTDTTVTTAEDIFYTFTTSDFGLTDPNDSPANSLLAVKITTVPGAGILKDNGVTVTAGQFVQLSHIVGGQLKFTPALNANGNSYTSFTFQVQDNGGIANGGVDLDPTPNTITVNVTPVNDVPVANFNPGYLKYHAGDSVVGPVSTWNIGAGSTDGTTLEGWVNWDGSTTGNQIPFYNGSGSTAGFGPIGEFLAPGLMEISILSGGVTVQQTGVSIAANEWHHIALTRLNGTIKLYLDGALAATSAQGVNPITTADDGINPNRVDNTYIGASGSVAEVRVWNVARSAAEIAATMSSTLTGDETGLVGYWPLNEGSGTIALDHGHATDTHVAGTQQNLTIAGATWGVGGAGWPVNGVATNEDTVIALRGLSISDVDAGGGAEQVTLTVGHGALALGDATGVSVTQDGSLGTLRFTGSIAAINAALSTGLNFTPTQNYGGGDTLSFTVNDQGNSGSGGAQSSTRQVALAVAPANDAPAGANATVTTAEDSVYTFTTTDFGFSDPNDSPANSLLAVKITTVPGAGSLKDNNATVNAGQLVSLSDITSGKLKFTPASDANGANYTSFTFQVQDNGGTANGGVDLDPTPNTITVNVTAVNDAPVLSTHSNTISYTENATAAKLLSTVTVSDADAPASFSGGHIQVSLSNTVAGDELLINSGTVTLSGTQVLVSGTAVGTISSGSLAGGATAVTIDLNASATTSAVNNVLQAIAYHSTSDNPTNVTRTASVVFDDGGNTGSGGPLSDSAAVTINVTPVNDTPLIAGASGAIINASTASNGSFATGGVSANPVITPDGHFVVFQSDATNLVGGDTNGTTDIFRKDLTTGEIVLISTSSSNVQGNGASTHAAVSADGRYVVFQSLASNLDPADTNTQSGIYLKDWNTGQLTLLSKTSAGVNAANASFNPSISADGHFVAFDSVASNLVAGDGNGSSDVFVVNLQTNAISLVSRDSTNTTQGNAGSFRPVLSSDGTYIAFDSSASNLIAGQLNDTRGDTFIKNLATGAIAGVDVSPTGQWGSGGSGLNGAGSNPAISADGQYVSFRGGATNLVLGVSTGGAVEAVVSNTRNGATSIASSTGAGTLAAIDVGSVSISADGRFVAFDTRSTALGGVDPNLSDVFLKDTLTGALIVVDRSASGLAANSNSGSASVSSDGRYVAFASTASNLVAGDTNNLQDIFVKDTGVRYVENAAAVAVASALTLSDADNASLAGATVSISGNFTAGQDVLSFTAQPGISGNYNPVTGVLTFSGTASVGAYQAVLQSVSYANSSDAPSAATRTISFQVNDGTVNSAAITANVIIEPVNDAPVAQPVIVNLAEDVSAVGVRADYADLDAFDAHTFTINTTGTAGSVSLIAGSGPNIIINGSFEDLSASGDNGSAGFVGTANPFNGVNWNDTATLFGWQHATTFPFELVKPNGTLPGNSGSVVLDLEVNSGGQNSDIYQDIPGITAGSSYRLSFDTAKFQSFTGTVEVFWNGAMVSRVTPTSQSFSTTYVDLIAVAAGTGVGGQNRLEFREIGAGTDGVGTILDNVQLHPVGPSDATFSFTPTTNFSGQTSFTYTVTDTSGGASAATVTVNVAAVNDAPAGTDALVTTAEDVVYTFTAADFGFTDPNDTPANSLLAVKITSVPGAGSLTNNNVAVTAGQFVSVSDITSGKLTFTPSANAYGNGYAGFSFQVKDNGGTANGGVDLDPTPNTITINVTAVNDAPVRTTNAAVITADEDTNPAITVATLFSGKFTDVDSAPSLKGIAVTGSGANPVTVGSWQYSTDNGANWLDFGTISASSALLLSADTLLRFSPVLDVNGLVQASSAVGVDDSYAGQFTNGATRVTMDLSADNATGGSTPFSNPGLALQAQLNPLNDAPRFSSLGPAAANTEQQFSLLDSDLNASVYDPEIVNPSQGFENWAGTTLTLQRHGGAVAEDSFSITGDVNGFFTVSGNQLMDGGQTIGTFASSGGVLTINFGPAAVSGIRLNKIVEQISYKNTSDNPSSSVVIDYALNDNNTANAQGAGGVQTGTGSVTVNIAPVNDAPVAHDDIISSTPGGWVLDADNGHSYRLVEHVPNFVGATWTEANAQANADGAYLATITSAAEQTFVANLVGARLAWIGGSDDASQGASEGAWKWVAGPEAGTQFWTGGSNGSAVPGRFAAWESGEPSSGAGENYLMFQGNRSGFWNDAGNGNQIAFVEEKGAPGAVFAGFAEDTSTTITATTLLANDNDADSLNLSITAVGATSPHGGSVSLANNLISYTPAANFNGADSFTYTVSDGSLTSSATVSFNVAAVNDAPVANNDSYVTDKNTALTVGAAQGLLANDTDIDSAAASLTAALVGTNGGALHGTITLSSNGSFTYAPTSNYTGTDSFTYRTSDGSANSSNATVNLTINASPVANGDSFATPYDAALTLTPSQLLANDIYVTPADLSIASVQNPLGGTVAIVSGNVVFTPVTGYFGPASFSYAVADGHGGTATANVAVEVIEPAQAGFDSEMSSEGHLGSRGAWTSSNPVQFNMLLATTGGNLIIVANDIENPTADGSASGEVDHVLVNGHDIGILTQGANAADTTTTLSVNSSFLVPGQNVVKIYNTSAPGSNNFTVVSAAFQSASTGFAASIVPDDVQRDGSSTASGNIGVRSNWSQSTPDTFTIATPAAGQLLHAALMITANDVEVPGAAPASGPSGELDKVFVNDHFVGFLAQAPDTLDSTTILNVDPSFLNAGNNVISMYNVNTDQPSTWNFAVNSVTLTGDTGPLISTQDINISQPGFSATIKGLSISDANFAATQFTVAATADHGAMNPATRTGNLSDTNSFFATTGESYTATASPANDKVAVTVTDNFGAADTVNVIFNVAGAGPNITLQGTAGKDVIVATAYQDTLTGGAGSDQFVFRTATGNDIISDFVPGLDKIDLHDFQPFTSGSTSSFNNWLNSGQVEQQGADTLIHLDASDSILLSHVVKTSLHINDFILHQDLLVA